MKYWFIVLLFAVMPFPMSVQAAQVLTPWQKVKQPVKGEPLSIGEVANGCLIGGQALPLQDRGYQVLRKDQHRYFGHPDLVHFIKRLSTQTEQAQLGTLLIGDMAMPAGGRFTSGHRSHQNGLDVDIWLQLVNPRWSAQQLAKPVAIDLVNDRGKQVINARWDPNLTPLIKLTAQDPSVARIFVHPAIKQKLCQTAGSDRHWLMKVRPWFGHRAHMHIRLKCPSNNLSCIDQPTPPRGDGCGEELSSWLADSRPLPSAKPQEAKLPPLPMMCQRLIDNKFKVK